MESLKAGVPPKLFAANSCIHHHKPTGFSPQRLRAEHVSAEDCSLGPTGNTGAALSGPTQSLNMSLALVEKSTRTSAHSLGHK